MHVDGYTTYVHVLQVLTKKQAVFCSPHLFITETLNTVSPVPADSHTSVCFIGKIAIPYSGKVWRGERLAT